MIDHLDLLMGERGIKNKLPNYSECPQTKALVDFILEDNDEQMRLDSEAVKNLFKK